MPSAEDERFTFGLLINVADVLARHGYPRAEGIDLVDLRQAPYCFLYVGRKDGGR
ncbi:hypothetical protein [Streptomyces cacaoi]|uniref:hypothetical protein n=1 Tax=Streptomyces cacaoi TaxID=1898 RepID=UPI00374818EB